jgi:hypothetical protein
MSRRGPTREVAILQDVLLSPDPRGHLRGRYLTFAGPSLLEDGRVAYRLREARKNGATHRVMTPLSLLAKLASLVPRPKIPLARYHGVFASRSSWRPLVTPKPTHDSGPSWLAPPFVGLFHTLLRAGLSRHTHVPMMPTRRSMDGKQDGRCSPMRLV